MRTRHDGCRGTGRGEAELIGIEGAGQPPVRQIVLQEAQIIEQRGLNMGDRALARNMAKQVDMALRYRRTNGMVRECEGPPPELYGRLRYFSLIDGTRRNHCYYCATERGGEERLGTKSPLQLRAEAAASRFHTTARSAIVIEFAGVPKAGKTTTLNAVQAFLRRCGFRVNVVVERASVCPIKDKKDSNFNIWTACTTLVQILDQTQIPPGADDPEILILDRGIFDSIWWFSLMVELARIREEDKLQVERFLLMDEWRKRISGVVVMLADPGDSLQRERGFLPVEGAHGSIMNPQVLGKTKELVQAAAERLDGEFRFFEVDTSADAFKGKPQETCEAVASKVLDWVEEQIEEHIYSVPKSVVQARFDGRPLLSPHDTEQLQDDFLKGGQFAARSSVEGDWGRVQALPVVVVRNQSGDVLILRRRETNQDDHLHQKLVIWAGGHVRKEDSEAGANPLTTCAARELHEELRLRIRPDDLRMLGSVYVDDATNTSKHVAIVYEWRAKTDYVAVSLNKAEFFERHGKSLTCNFSPISALQGDQDLHEAWSLNILQGLLA